MYWKAYSATKDQWWVSLDKERWIEALWEPVHTQEEWHFRRGFAVAASGADPAPTVFNLAQLPQDVEVTTFPIEADTTPKKRFVVPERGTMFAHIQDSECKATVSVTPWRDRPGQEITCKLLAHSGNAMTDTAKLLDVDALELAEKLDLPAIIVPARALCTRIAGRLVDPDIGQLFVELRRALDSVPARALTREFTIEDAHHAETGE